VSNHILKSNY